MFLKSSYRVDTKYSSVRVPQALRHAASQQPSGKVRNSLVRLQTGGTLSTRKGTRQVWKKTLIVCGLIISMNVHPVHGESNSNVGAKVPVYQTGLASFYGQAHAGRKTASGSRFNPHDLTAAHNGLPFGTVVEVLYPITGKSVVVKITDRGGFGKYGRIIDLSQEAAHQIGITGVGKVELRILKQI